MPLAGKFGRIRVASANIGYMNAWRARFRRERLDTTNFESAAAGVNVFSEGLTGPIDSIFSVEGYADDVNLAVFFPGATLSWDFFFRKASPIGYTGIAGDILGFEPGGNVRQLFTFTAEIQANGLVA